MFSSTLNPNSNGTDLTFSQLSSIGAPQEQSTPAFLFGKRKTTVPSNFTNSPLNSASAPCADIFAYPAQSNIPQHVKESETTAGSKSVHWSPSLVQSQTEKPANSSLNNSMNLSSGPLSSSYHSAKPIPQSFTGQAINAPPLRSLRDKIEPAKKVARRNTFAARTPVRTPTSTPNTTRLANTEDNANITVDESSAADSWVTVFGFQPNQVSILLNLFSRHGEVVSHQTPSKGNFMHIRYSCVTHAQQALSRNGTLLDQETFIGVVPCNNKDVINGSAAGIVSRSNAVSANRSMSMYQSLLESDGASPSDQSIYNENMHNNSLMNTSGAQFDQNNSLNSSRISVRSGVGMRPLVADQRNNGTTPQKQDGLLNKLWNTIGLN